MKKGTKSGLLKTFGLIWSFSLKLVPGIHDPRIPWSLHFMTPTFHDYSLEPKSQNAGTLCIWYWQTITTYLHRSLQKIRPCMSHIFQKSHRTRFRPGYFDMRILWIENELDLIWLTFCVLRLHKIWETLYLECYWH